MSKKEVIAILYGGKSGEHEVSLRSACSVYHHIDRSMYVPLLIGISRDGRWYLQPETDIPGDTEILPLAEDEGSPGICPSRNRPHLQRTAAGYRCRLSGPPWYKRRRRHRPGASGNLQSALCGCRDPWQFPLHGQGCCQGNLGCPGTAGCPLYSGLMGMSSPPPISGTKN